MCKKFKFDHSNKWYIHNPAPLREYDTQTPMGLCYTNRLLNLGKKTRPYNNQQQKKKISKIVDFPVPVDYRIKLKECEKRDKYLNLARELKKTMEYGGDNYTDCDWCFWHGNQTIIEGPGRFRSWRPSWDHQNNSIIENGQNTEKIPGNLRGLAVTQSPVKDHQSTLMWKKLMSNNSNNNSS